MNDELLNLGEIQNVTFARGRALEMNQALREAAYRDSRRATSRQKSRI